MAIEDIERWFPALKGKKIELSPEDFNYNCLAYALGDHFNWWEPPSGYGQYWPPGFPDDTTVATVESIIRLHGFTVEVPIGDRPASEAIAIYANGEDWDHFAKFSNGVWSCKCGDGNDLVGVTLPDLEVPDYGKVVKILCRPT